MNGHDAGHPHNPHQYHGNYLPNGGMMGGVASPESGSIPNPLPPQPTAPPPKKVPWVVEHPGAALAIITTLFAGIQYMAKVVMVESEPIQDIRTAIRTLANHQLEAQAENGRILRELAAKEGIRYDSSDALTEAERAVRELRTK